MPVKVVFQRVNITVYKDKTAYVDYDKTLLSEFSIMCKVEKKLWVALRLAANADSDSRDFRSSGCRGLQFAATAYSMSQSLVVSSCVASLCLFISSFAPPSLSLFGPTLRLLEKVSGTARRMMPRRGRICKVLTWEAESSVSLQWKTTTTNKMKRKLLWDV